MIDIEHVTNETFLKQVKYLYDISCSNVIDVYANLDNRSRNNFDKFVDIYMNKAGCPTDDVQLRQACVELALKYYFL